MRNLSLTFKKNSVIFQLALTNMSPDVRERSRTEDDSDTWEDFLKVFHFIFDLLQYGKLFI